MSDATSAAGATEPLVELSFPARADRLKLARASVLAAARMCGFDEQAAQDIVLAVNEACQNVIVHAYKGRDDGRIELSILRERDGVVFRVRDFAPPVDPATIRPRDLDDVMPGGLGTHFIREIMDAADFSPLAAGGNLLEMKKRTGDPT
ncbi:MAG: ATP-binding protein [Alphaproteobacteria bacterium]